MNDWMNEREQQREDEVTALKARLAEAERERDALRAVAQQFLADYHSADGMASYKQYAHEFRTALTADSAEDGTKHHPNCTPPCGICEPDEWEKAFLRSAVDPADGI